MAVTGAGLLRASDQEREATVRVLQEAYAAGRLDLAELRGRSGAAWQACTRAHLAAVTADLPTGPEVTGTVSTASWQHSQPRAWPAPADPAALLPATLACLALAAAIWQPAALIPLIMLALPILAAAFCPPASRPLRTFGEGHQRRPAARTANRLGNRGQP